MLCMMYAGRLPPLGFSEKFHTVAAGEAWAHRAGVDTLDWRWRFGRRRSSTTHVFAA
jgi:hypothetical protein